MHACMHVCACMHACATHPRPPHARPADGTEVQLPLLVKDAFQAVVRTCAVTREGLGTLEEFQPLRRL